MTNTERFIEAYTKALAYYVAKNPTDYAYTVEDVPRVVAKMVPAYAKGSACTGPAMKRAARALGINPTLRDVKAFLSHEGMRAADPAPDEARAFLASHVVFATVR